MPSHRVHARPASADVDGDSVPTTTDPEIVAGFLEDAAHSPGGHARVVVHPRTEAEVVAVVRDARHVLPVGAQSSLTGGATPMGETVLATDRLDRVLDIGASHITVQAGVPLSGLQAVLASRNAYYPPVPTFEGALAGGVVATNAAGATTFKYGSTRDWVRGLTVVLPDGSVLDLERGTTRAHPDGYFEIVGPTGTTRIPVPEYRMPDVPKRSAGYFAEPGMDLVDLFVGSEGTLGVVTQVTFAVLPQRPATCLVWLPLPDDQQAFDLVAALRRETRATWANQDPRGIDVSAIEHLDRRSLELVQEDGADRRYDVAISDNTVFALLVQIDLPTDSIPTTDDAYAQISTALADDARDTPLVRFCQLIARARALDWAEVALPANQRRQTQLFALREAVPEAVNRRIGQARVATPGISKTAADMIVPFEKFNQSVRMFRSAFDRRGLDYAIWGHISDGNVHPNVIATRLEHVHRGREAILECGRHVIELGGCPLAEHGVGRNPMKQTLLRELYGDEGIAQMRRVKQALDPRWRLAPGVIFPVFPEGSGL